MSDLAGLTPDELLEERLIDGEAEPDEAYAAGHAAGREAGIEEERARWLKRLQRARILLKHVQARAREEADLALATMVPKE